MPLAKPIIVLGIHGLGGHSGWFENLDLELKKYDIDFVAHDLPGFGNNHLFGKSKSEYIKGHLDSYQEWVDFVQEKYEALKHSHPASKIIIFGHSLGGVIASCLPQIYKGDLLVLSVPGFKGASSTFNPGFTLGVLKKIIIDKLVLRNDVFVEMPVSPKSKRTPAMTDPLRVGTVTQTLLLQILQMGAKAQAKVLKKTNPCFLIQVENDAVVDNATQDRVYEKLSSTHKQKRVYIGTDHDWIWNKEAVKLVTQDLVEWAERF